MRLNYESEYEHLVTPFAQFEGDTPPSQSQNLVSSMIHLHSIVSRTSKTSTLNTKLPLHRGHYLQNRTQSARDRQPRTRAPEGAGKRRAGAIASTRAAP
eukprot:5659998-Pleurochrysis_carterae.AAC.3